MYFSFKEKFLRNIYNLLTYIVGFHLKLIANFNKKLKLGVIGRSQTFQLLESGIGPTDSTLWFHCASLGEYEQGLPVFEEIKKLYPQYKVVLSFFSPSGFEVRKNSPIADVVVYLPLDTRKNARRFVKLVHPELVVFVKYEIWPNYLLELQKNEIKTILISALFRKDQTYFKTSGKWIQRSLASFDHIFVQNQASLELLKTIGYSKVTVSGDTRFDRVSKQLERSNKFDFMDEFAGDKLCIIGGSTWPEDHELFVQYIKKTNHDIKFVIAPHNIKQDQIQKLEEDLGPEAVLYSQTENKNMVNARVMIIDTIGLLSALYSYAHIAYVGGALGTSGLHNTLEAAVFGMPIVIGSNYEKFPEAHEMISRGGMKSISSFIEFEDIMNTMVLNGEIRSRMGKLNSDYIKENEGAVIQIMDYLRK